MEFRILGPLEVVEDGRPISIRRRGKEQALLAYLLLHANEVVPSGTLIDVLWDERPPADGVEDSSERGLPPAQAASVTAGSSTSGSGLPAAVEKDELDLDRFERLAREGRGRRRSRSGGAPPLLDLREERFADEARRRLEEQRLAVIEDRVDENLAAGKARRPRPRARSACRLPTRYASVLSVSSCSPCTARAGRAMRSRPTNVPDAGSRVSSGSSRDRSCRN